MRLQLGRRTDHDIFTMSESSPVFIESEEPDEAGWAIERLWVFVVIWTLRTAGSVKGCLTDLTECLATPREREGI